MAEKKYPTDDAFHDGSASDLELNARRYAAAVALGIISDEIVEQIASELGLTPEEVRSSSPLLAISLARSASGTRQ